jgi:hypothetical protein
VQKLAHWRTPDRIPELFKHWLGRRATLNSNRLVQKLRTLIGKSESVAAINGPTWCGLEAKKLNHFSRACTGVYVYTT